jgi:hypothetical protein
MPVHGDLKTMSLCDLLQWAGLNHKTGVLELERNKVCRRIEFRKGKIGACSSDDPPSLLGQFLLSRGKITRECLQRALARQERTGENLGVILRDEGAMTQVELTRQVAAKAEETIQGLFDWEDAVFRFHEGATLEPNQIEVNLSVDDVLLKGIQHHDELQRMRKIFESSGVVLRHTGKPAPSKLLARTLPRQIWESIDGKKTLAEILLHAHGSEFLVIKLLYTLHTRGFVEIQEVRPAAPDAATLLDPPAECREEDDTKWDVFGLADLDPNVDLPETSGVGAPVAAEAPPMTAAIELDEEIDVASRMLARGEYEAALELLNASYRLHPNENHLRRLIAKAEKAYVKHVQRCGLSYDRVPVVREARDESSGDLGPQECFLMSLFNGEADVRSILWVAPLREVDALRTMRQLVDKQVIELREPTADGSADTTVESTAETNASGRRAPRADAAD